VISSGLSTLVGLGFGWPDLFWIFFMLLLFIVN
jgi:hypothetical protein